MPLFAVRRGGPTGREDSSIRIILLFLPSRAARLQSHTLRNTPAQREENRGTPAPASRIFSTAETSEICNATSPQPSNSRIPIASRRSSPPEKIHKDGDGNLRPDRQET